MDPRNLFDLLLVTLLAGYLPIIAYTFHRSRKQQRDGEVRRVMEKLNVDPDLREAHALERNPYGLSLAVGFAFLVAFIGLAQLLLGIEMGIGNTPGWCSVASFPPFTWKCRRRSRRRRCVI